jgi:hypothetical protein
MSPLLGFIRQLCIPHEQLAIMQWLVPSGKWQAKPPRVSAISYDASNCYEARYPYLDRRLCEFLFSIPGEQILRSMQRRSLMRQALVGIVPSEILQRKRKAFRCASLHDLVRRGLADTARSFPSLPQPPPVYRQPVYKQRRILTSACCQHSWAIFKPHSVELYYQQIGFCALKQRGCSGRNAAYSNYRLSLPRSQSARPIAKKAVFHAVTSRIKPRRVTSVPLVMRD